MSRRDKKPKKVVGYKPRWHQTEFGLLLKEYWFKLGKGLGLWWIKDSDTLARSPGGLHTLSMRAADPVWVDLSVTLDRKRLLGE